MSAAESNWPAPDMSLLNHGRRPPPPMPSGLFGAAWSLIEDVAEGTSTPVDYPGIALLVACASLIGGKRRVQPYQASNWQEPAILWGAIVGDPSARKSPALSAIVDPLRLLELDHAEDYQRARQSWNEENQLARMAEEAWSKAASRALKDGHEAPPMPADTMPPSEPQRRRTLVSDATPEAMAAILAGNPMGTLFFRDEIAGWLLGFERYAPGGREFWLEAYGGRAFAIDRKGSKDPTIVPFNGVSVLGGIQPEKLAAMMLKAADDGLLARLLLVWPDKRPFIRPTKKADIAKLESLYRRLDGLDFDRDQSGRHVPRVLLLSPEAADIFEKWQQDNERADEDASHLFKSFIGKMDGTVLRLALVAELIWWALGHGAEPTSISADALLQATCFVDAYCKPMAERVYGDAALPEIDRNAGVLARYIRKTGLTRFVKRDLMRSPHKRNLPNLGMAPAMNDAIERLIDAGWLIPDFTRSGNSPGMKEQAYLVNPAALRDT